MKIPVFQVDSFADAPFAGNPAAVCILPEPRDDGWMQNLAAEMNLSDTAFLRRQGYSYELRWFTPTTEVDLCGHATLAAAHVLWEEGYLPGDAQARFDTRSGFLTAERRGGLIEMDFPSAPPEEADPPVGLLEALDITPLYIGRTALDYIVEVDSEDAVREIEPDYPELECVTMRGVIVTALGELGDYDFISRFFAPAAGINEDPVTGSAHCALGPYWQERLGKDEMVGYQASERGGSVRVRVAGDRVILGGHAVTIFRGQLAESI